MLPIITEDISSEVFFRSISGCAKLEKKYGSVFEGRKS